MKKYDKQEVENLLEKIAAEMKRKPAQRNTISLSLKQINIVKAINPDASQTLQGSWNGYGYENLGKHLFKQDYKEILKGLKKLNIEVKEKKVITEEDRIDKWVKRLAKLGNITIEEADQIANEKIEYKQEQIEKMEERQYERESKQRATLIRKMERENPLRYIKDVEHAEAILAASKRHKDTDYEDKLEEGREMAAQGIIDREDVKGYARREMN